MSLRIKVKCPKCRKVWTVVQGTPDIVCDCHLYCDKGSKPGDCVLVRQTYTGNLNLYRGLHLGHADSDDEKHRTYYCSTHDYYSCRQPVIIETGDEVAAEWFRGRAPKSMREVGLDPG